MVKCGPHTYKRCFFKKALERKTPPLLHKVAKLRKHFAVIVRSSSNNIIRLTENNSHLTINLGYIFGSRLDNECVYKLMVDHQRRFFAARPRKVIRSLLIQNYMICVSFRLSFVDVVFVVHTIGRQSYGNNSRSVKWKLMLNIYSTSAMATRLFQITIESEKQPIQNPKA